MEKQEAVTSNAGSSATSDAQSFQRLKFWIGFLKWFVVSVALVIVTTIIDWGFRDREATLAELKLYDRYVTELIVLNQNPVQKRMLAQFFAAVTPSEKLKKGWECYLALVEKEYRDYVKPILHEDSVLRARYVSLLETAKYTDAAATELKELELRIHHNEQLLHPALVLPASGEGLLKNVK